MKRIIQKPALFFFGSFLLATGCSKPKTDDIAGHVPNYNNLTSSTVRLVMGDGLDLKVNDTRLTNWLPLDLIGLPTTKPNPTPYFPITGKLTNTYYLPEEFLDGNGQAIVEAISPQNSPIPDLVVDSFQVKEDYNNPIDYYLLDILSHSDGQNGFTKVPRAVSPAADPTHIRIRLLNLGAVNAGGAGPLLSLSFANGSRVSPVTSGIPDGQWSDYVELPYGTYQFRVLIDGTDFQIPGKPPVLMNTVSLSDITIAGGQYYVPTRTFQPGGVYTILVSAGSAYQWEEYPLPVDGFSFVTDINPPANLTYGQIQVVNAAEENGLQVSIDGVKTSVAYGTGGDYHAFVTGTHDVKVTDAAGKVLAEKNISMKGGDNLSLWVYPTPGGTDSILSIQNNMGGVVQQGANSDGTDAATLVLDPLNFGMIAQARFLNLCPDLPYVSFTRSSGGAFPQNPFSSALAAQNLQPGLPADPIVIPYPYVDLGPGSYSNVEVYQSKPQVVPGDRLTGVPALTPADFVHLPAALYPNEAAGVEPGVYTVALIGRSKTNEQPKMIVIKHNH